MKLISKWLIVVTVLYLCLHVQGFAQLKNINISQYNSYPVADIPTTKILELKQKLSEKNINFNDFVKLATMNGLSSTKANQLVQRMKLVELNNNTNQPDSGLTTATFDSTQIKLTPPQKTTTSEKNHKVFGKSLFEKDKVSFQPNINIPTPENYILGPGDEIIIDIWGAAKKHYQLLISKEGFIQLENIGPIYVTGLSINNARSRIISRLGELYVGLKPPGNNTYAQVYIGKIRSIKITVLGQAEVPGTFSLPSTSTLFHALYVSGGPNQNGSFRNIQLIRNNKKLTELDLYEYLLTGTASSNEYLRDGDIVLIPTYTKRIEISGEVLTNGLFELKEGESANKLIQYAGGFTANAYTNLIQLTRNTDREHVIKDISKDEINSLTLQNGDKLLIRKIIDKYANRVQLEGALQMPGSYEINSKTSLLDVIDKAEGLHPNAFLERALLLRYTDNYTRQSISINLRSVIDETDTIWLQPDDVVHIYFIDELHENRTVKIEGSIMQSGDYPYYPGITLQDIIAQAGGFTDAAAVNNIEIARRIQSLETSNELAQLFTFEVNPSLGYTNNDFELNAFDYIIVRKAPGYHVQNTVIIEGEVLYPGIYVVQSKSEKLSDLIARAGGTTLLADLNGARLLRKSGDGINAVGIDLYKILEDKKSTDDFKILPGDRIIIPSTEQTINVKGAVLNPIALHFEKGQSLRHYVNQTGGFDLRAQKRKIYVVYANNTSQRVKNYLLFKKYPNITAGATIYIPYKPERDKLEAQKVLSISSGITTISLVIVSIIRTLNTM
ncbi:hypothetical protein GC194_10020 [bacterium]|nr:hypothetical protein [bacterium]